MVAERFIGADIKEAESLLACYEGKFEPRVLKCAVHASKGDPQKLHEAPRLADLDWRDVIVMGEYEVIGKKLVRIRGFG